MNIVINNADEPFDLQDGWHILTFAENGMSPLGVYACHDCGIDRSKIDEFVDNVNRNNISDSLYPEAPISVIPSKYFREESNSQDLRVLNEFKTHIKEFIALNSKTIKSRNLVIEFHVSPSPVPQQYIDATNQVLQSYRGKLLENIIIQQTT